MDTGRLIGAMAGGVVAGLGLTALLMAGERREGKPSELADLERAGARRLGIAVPGGAELPARGEQAIIQGGHLALSALAGAAYAVSVEEDAGILPSGIAFGAAFYGLAHWVTGPLLGVKAPEWQAGGKTIGLHAVNHLVFGITVAAFAKAFSHR